MSSDFGATSESDDWSGFSERRSSAAAHDSDPLAEFGNSAPSQQRVRDDLDHDRLSARNTHPLPRPPSHRHDTDLTRQSTSPRPATQAAEWQRDWNHGGTRPAVSARPQDANQVGSQDWTRTSAQIQQAPARRRLDLRPLVFAVAAIAIAVGAFALIRALDLADTSTDDNAVSEVTSESSTDEVVEADEEPASEDDQVATDASATSETAEDAATTDESATVTPDPDWPGGTGPVPTDPPIKRIASLSPDGNMVLTGSAPDWATVTKIVQFAGDRLPGGPDAVDNQLMWHPDANTAPQGGDVVMTGAATFETNGAELAADSAVGLDLISQILIENPTVFAVIVGHADISGPEEINAQIAADRANVVVQDLVDRGVVAGQLIVASASSDAPMAENDTEAGRAENRRVDVHLENFLSPRLGLES